MSNLAGIKGNADVDRTGLTRTLPTAVDVHAVISDRNKTGQQHLHDEVPAVDEHKQEDFKGE